VRARLDCCCCCCCCCCCVPCRYATFADVGGLPPSALVDHEAAAAGLPPVDAISLWPYLSGAVPESPRRQLVLGTGDGAANGIIVDYGSGSVTGHGHGSRSGTGGGHGTGHGTGGGHGPSNNNNNDDDDDNNNAVNATGLWKLLVDDEILFDGWTGPECPNATFVSPGVGRCEPFCLYVCCCCCCCCCCFHSPMMS
jgi:hypothetical protein